MRAADIIDALNVRAGVRMPRERSTGMPYGWALWLKARAAAMRVPVPHPQDVAGLLAARPPRSPPRGEELTHAQALLALFRQGWLPPPPEERVLRGLSGAGSIAVHLLFLVLLAWMAYLQSLPPPPEAAGGGGGSRIGVGFVSRDDAGQGEGSPGVLGDAPPAQPIQAARSRSGPAPRADAVEQAAPTEPAPSLDPGVPQMAAVPVEVVVPARPQPPLPELQVREVPAPAEPQLLVEVPVPAMPVAPPEPQVQERPLEVREREVEVVQAPAIVAPVPRPVDIPLPVAPEPELRPREVVVVEAPALQVPPARTVPPRAAPVRLPELREREVAAPLPAFEVAAPAVAEPSVRPRPAATPSLRQRDIALRDPAPAGAPAVTPVPAPAAPAPRTAGTAASGGVPAPGSPAQSTPAPAPRASEAPGSAAAAAAAALPGDAAAAPPGTRAASGTGDTRPGGGTPGRAADPWAQTLADDRWAPAGDAGSRSPGLFDADGRARLPGTGEGQGPGQGPGQGSGEGEALAERGAPGGANDAWSRERIEQSGTWLKRPPYDYEPTSFDRYWMPNQSLLAEWVRKGIQTVAIPIPGSNGKKLNCVVSLLQLGGGCGVSDANLNEQPAVARPPPDIPFKPQLQEDNGSVPR